MTEPRRLPLHEQHAQDNAKFVAFAGWEVPVYYTSIIDEHVHVRTDAGIFDISHMGQMWIEGRQAVEFLQWIVTNNVNRIGVGQTLYSPVCNENGGIVDDVILYRFSDTRWMMVVNASNVEKVWRWINIRMTTFHREVGLSNPSRERGIFAVQGPNAMKIAVRTFGPVTSQVKHHHFMMVRFQGRDLIFSATGYTGEPGFELFFDRDLSLNLWRALLSAGEPFDLQPVGFGARDTLRLEAKCLLYGNDMDDTTTPLEAGLGWTVDFSKSDFVGKSALVRQKKAGIQRKLVGFEVEDRAVARHGYPVVKASRTIGHVTSGAFSPTLQKSIGLAYVEIAESEVGSAFSIVIRDREHPARVVATPFYRSPYLEK